MASVDFYFDFGSPTAYIAYKVLPAIAEKASAEINWKPILLGAVHKASNNTSPAFVPAKGKWMNKDLALWIKKYQLDYQFNSSFPINTLPLMRGASGLQRTGGNFTGYCEAVYNAVWRDNKNMGDPEVIGAVLTEAGFDPNEFLALINDQATKDHLKAETQACVKRGLFGAPTMFVGDHMFFGQDRLFMVAEALGINIRDIYPDY